VDNIKLNNRPCPSRYNKHRWKEVLFNVVVVAVSRLLLTDEVGTIPLRRVRLSEATKPITRFTCCNTSSAFAVDSESMTYTLTPTV
jgi:hypothetical protein